MCKSLWQAGAGKIVGNRTKKGTVLVGILVMAQES